MSYLMAVMQAVSNCMASGSNQQLADAQTTTLDVKVENQVVSEWAAKVAKSAEAVKYWANACAQDPTNKALQYDLQEAQASYQQTNTLYDQYKNQADSGTQAANNKTGQDSQTMQMKVQLMAAVNQINQTLSSAIAQT
jgi:hypothetical protein